MSKKAAVMRGDGIGPEVVDSMLKVLKECNMQSEVILCEAGSEQWDKNGRKDKSYIPDATMRILEESDACFKGPKNMKNVNPFWRNLKQKKLSQLAETMIIETPAICYSKNTFHLKQ